jgi:RecA/RadA recombinase
MLGEIEWLAELKPALDQAYMIKGLLDHGAMSVLYGPSNSGKTFFALDVAFHIAAARQRQGRRVHAGTVLYLAAEGGNGIANRMVALRERTGLTEVPLALRRAGLDLLKPEADLPRLVQLADEIGIDTPLNMIVVDTLSRVIAGGDENGPVDMTAFVRNVDELRQKTGAHVMVVHHTGKDVARGARGHNSLRAATDTEIEIQIDEDGGRSAVVTKQRDHPGGETFCFALDPVPLGKDQDGDPVSSCVVIYIEPKQSPDGTPPTDVCRKMLKAIDEGWESKNPLSTVPQSKATGRYAPRYLAERFGLKQVNVGKLLSSWIDNEIIVLDVVDRRSKRKGLRVLEWI